MIRPPSLQRGDTVGIVAPARRITPGEVEGFFKVMQDWGFHVKTENHLFDAYHQFAGKDEVRVADLQRMMDDPDVKAIFFARGGYGTVRVAPQLDFTVFRKNPKWLIGFSDLTVIHSMVNHVVGVETLHAEMPVNFGGNTTAGSLESIRKLLTGESPTYDIPGHSLNIAGRTSGILTGGNLSVLYSLRGTSFDLPPEDKILFLEDLDEYLYHIDRMMMNLKLGGIFEKVKGMIIGYMNKMHDKDVSFGKNAYEIIREQVEDKKIPVCFGFPAGHEKKNVALVMGRKVTLTVKKEEVSIQFKS